MKLQKVETDIIGRIETGPTQIGDDWPGVFIRGDNALYTAMALRQAAEMLQKYIENDPNAGTFTGTMSLTELQNHATLLSSCNIQLHRE